MTFFDETIELPEIVKVLFTDAAMLSQNAGDFFAERRAICGEPSEVEESLGDLACITV